MSLRSLLFNHKVERFSLFQLYDHQLQLMIVVDQLWLYKNYLLKVIEALENSHELIN